MQENYTFVCRNCKELCCIDVNCNYLLYCILQGLFYAVGGRNTSPGSSYDSDWVDVYNPATEHWRPCSPMSTPRHRVSQN